MVADPMDDLDENTCPRCGNPWNGDGLSEACSKCLTEDRDRYAAYQRMLDDEGEGPRAA